MIERETGEIQFQLNGIRVGPSLSREQFLASPTAAQSRVMVRNEPHCSFAPPIVQFDEHSFAWSLQFTSSVLVWVSIVCADTEFGSSWSDWSEERQLALNRFHDSLLALYLGPDWRLQKFTWGAVDSGYHPKSGFSSITVSYMRSNPSRLRRPDIIP